MLLRPDAKDEARTRLRRGERRKVLEKGPSLISLKETCIRYVARNALLFETFPIPEELKEKIIREMIDKEIFTETHLLLFADRNLRGLHLIGSSLTAHMLIDVWPRCPQLATVNVSGVPYMSDNDLILIAKHCPMLTELDVSGCKLLTNKSMAALGEGCMGLQKLSVLGVPTITAFKLPFPKLKEMTDEGICSLAHGSPLLEGICLHGCKEITDKSLIALADNCPNLMKLKVGKCKLLTDEGLIAISAKCKKLAILDASDCLSISGASIDAFVENQQPLARLDVSRCWSIPDESLSALFHSTKKGLTHLGLSKVVFLDNSIKDIITACPKLEFLDLSESWNINNAIFDAFSMEGTILPNLKQLSMAKCVSTTDEVVSLLSLRCPQLTSLDLTGCMKISESGIKEICNNLSELKKLRLRECWNILEIEGDKLTSLDLGWTKVIESPLVYFRCPLLKSVTVATSDIINEALEALLSGCPKLRSLNISRCKNLNSTKIAMLVATFCKDIEFLSMAGISLFSADIRYILSHCKKIQMLNLAWVAGDQEVIIQSAELRTLKVFGSCFGELYVDCPKLVRLDCSACMDLIKLRLSTSTAASLSAIDCYGCAMLLEEEWEEFLKGDWMPVQGTIGGTQPIEIEARERSPPCFAKLKLFHVGCTQLSHQVIEKLIAACPLLVSLSLARCTSISDLPDLSPLGDLAYLDLSETRVPNLDFLMGNTKLKNLTLEDTMISAAMMQKLMAACPSLVAIFMNKQNVFSDLRKEMA